MNWLNKQHTHKSNETQANKRPLKWSEKCSNDQQSLMLENLKTKPPHSKGLIHCHWLKWTSTDNR